MRKRPVILDCDTGGDDAAAICLAAASNDIELLGVTTCMGNLPLEQAYRNTRQLMHFLQRDIPVLKGSSAPLKREYWVGTESDRPLPVKGLTEDMAPPQSEDAVEWMAKTLRQSEHKVTLIPLAPLTNIARLMITHPDLVREKVDEIILMGGGTIPNPRPYKGATGVSTGIAELNIFADPEAAQTVFEFGVPVVMCGLDVCHRGYILNSENKEIRAVGNRAASAFADVTDGALAFADKGDTNKAQAVIYDSIPIVYALAPSLFESVTSSIEVELHSPLCTGFTVCEPKGDEKKYWSKAPKIHKVVMNVDRSAYLEKVKTILGEYTGQTV